MKSTKTKKLLGGVAIAAVSLGCLGLAGIANADTHTNMGASGSPTAQTSGAYQLPKTLTGAMTGTTTITANISGAQAAAGQKITTDHTLEYIQIGSYIGHGTSASGGSGAFSFSATNQAMEDDLYNFITTASSDGLKAAFPNASYTSANGEALNWLMTGNSSGTFLGADASGQAGYGTSANTDYAVRLLANYLYANIPSTDLTAAKWLTGGTDSTGSFDLPNPGVYLLVDTTDSGNASLPIILSTKPSTGYTIPSTMTNYITDTIALKDQDPQATPVKQFVKDPTTNSSGDLTGGTLTGSMTSTVGSSNTVTYQVSNVFPNTNGYPSYVYKFIDQPGTGMTLNIKGGANMYVAGIPLTTLVGDGDATVTLTTATHGSTPGNTTIYGNGTGNTDISSMPILVGGTDANLTVALNEAGMQYIAAHGYQTSNVSGKSINFGTLTSQSDVSQTVNGSTNTMSGVNKGASSYTGQTQAAASGENGNTASTEYPQAGGELFGLTYQAYLNSDVAWSNGTTEATNTAMTDNNGTDSTPTTPVPLTTSGTYNGGSHNNSGKTAGTTQTNPDQIPGTDHNGKTDGVPNKTAVGAGLTWMKVWGSGDIAKGASFYVQNSSKQYLYATGAGWGWTTNKSDAQKFGATATSTTPAPAASSPTWGLFEINGLGDGTYTVTEAHAATGADQSVLPSFTITLTSGQQETVTTSSASLNLVNNTPNGTYNDTTFNTVENVKNLMGLPLTGGAGILTGVIAAVILFGTAGIVLVVYKRRKQQND